MNKVVTAALLSLTGSVVVLSQPAIYLKNRMIDTQVGQRFQVRGQRMRTVAAGKERVHVIAQFETAPGDEQANNVRALGGVVLGYVHENGLLISIGASVRLDTLNARWIGTFEASDKVSALLREETSSVVVEIYDDIDLADARTLIVSLGIELQENPDLPANQLLARASKEQARTLASYDAIEYVFPASEDLAKGRPLIACASALTTQGKVGQSIARMGEGWDGAGLGSASITYSWGAMTQQMPISVAQGEIVRALNEWSKYAKVSFSPGTQNNSARNIDILFGTRDHGDGFSFDGRGNVLAHTFYPAPPNPEPIAGDMHFDDEETWNVGADKDLFSVALHELGHALGLGHSDKPGSVMYPYYRRATELTGEDIDAIQTLYAAQISTAVTPAAPAPLPLTLTVAAVGSSTSQDNVILTGTATGGSGPITVRWSTDKGPSGTASGSSSWTLTASLSTGANQITVVAADSENVSASQIVSIIREAAPVAAPVTLTVAPASNSTTQDHITLTGTSAGGTGAVTVRWSTDKGLSGTASGSSSWSLTAGLSAGVNQIVIVAADALNVGTSQMIMITRQAAALAPAPPTPSPTPAPAPAPAPVTVQLTSPGAALTYATNSSSMTFKGLASHPTGVARVAWSNNRGGTGLAMGTATWQTPAVTLYEGDNLIAITVTATNNTISALVIQVVYNRSHTSGDTTAPSIAITNPNSTYVVTSDTSIVLQGTATDNTGVTSIEYLTGTSVTGRAAGTTTWITPAIPLYVGLNTIIVRAFDAAGNMGWRVLQVTRR